MGFQTITISKSYKLKSIKLIMGSNKLKNTINIIGNKIVLQSPADLKMVQTLLQRNFIPFT